MYDQNTRINAAITYFFMGPIFLLARAGTPFSHPFVREHAKKSSLYMAIFAVILFIFFGVRKYLYINVFGLSLDTIILSVLLIGFFLFMILAWYKAFQGNSNSNTLEKNHKNLTEFHSENYTEETRIRIITAFLPIFGIFLATKNPLEEIKIARKVWNFFLFFILLFAILFKGFVNFPVFIVLAVYIALFVATAVFLMAESKFLHIKYYNLIPTYHELEAKIHASIESFFDFFRIAFGKEKTKNFSDRYHFYLEKYSTKTAPETAFWTHPAIIAIPLINIFTIPSFFREKFHEYQGNIAEWFLLTIFAVLIAFFGNNFMFYMLIFPIATLIAEAKTNINIRAPFVSIARNLFIFAYKTKQKINTLQENNKEEVFTFDASKSISETQNPDSNKQNRPV